MSREPDKWIGLGAIIESSLKPQQKPVVDLDLVFQLAVGFKVGDVVRIKYGNSPYYRVVELNVCANGQPRERIEAELLELDKYFRPTELGTYVCAFDLYKAPMTPMMEALYGQRS